METEELCSVNISPLVTIPFVTQWSPDNQISIITEKGVHVLEFVPSPMSSNPTFKFARSFIYPSDTLPACAFENEIDSLVWNQERKEVYPLFNNDATTSKSDGVTDKFPKIVKVAWSPKNLISSNQCVLAILNSAGVVELVHKVSNNWYSICNISFLRLKIIREEIKTNLNKHNFHKKSSNQYAKLTESMRKLQACSMTWSELFKIEEASFAYFSVAYDSGDILIWKIPRISNVTKSLHPVLVGRIDLNQISKMNVLCWITINANKHLIVVGYSDGGIYGVNLMDRHNSLQIVSIEKYVDANLIKVNYLYIIPQDKLNIKILAAKENFLLLLCINSTGVLKSMRQLCIQGSNITGIIPIVAEQFLITTKDSHTFIVDTQSNDLVKMNIKSHLPQTRVQYLGLAHSPNKVIFVNITSPDTVYDHLVMREPSTMHIFSLKGATCNPLSIINESASLGNIWDCMEILRLKAAKAKDPCTVLCPNPKKLESLSFYKLQVSMWMTVMMNVCTTKKSMLNMDHVREGKITQALPLIFLHSACAYLENLMKTSTLSKDQMLAVTLLRRYLEMYQGVFEDEDANNENAIHQRVQKMLNATMSYPNQTEKCNLCGDVIDEMWHVKPCPRGHKLSRCSTTLLQITLLEYRVCPICGQIFHPCLEDVYEEPQCQFCDVPILRNLYDFDAKDSELYGKNLSQPQIADITESSRDPESEEPPDKQRRSKWDTSRTYSVIVNDDDDESGRITEKWEKF